VLDDKVQDALGQLASRQLPPPQAGQQAAAASGVRLQVVSLGCGVDTRPWRLNFPAGTAWWVAWVDAPAQHACALPEGGLSISRDTSTSFLAASAKQGSPPPSPPPPKSHTPKPSATLPPPPQV
jgi:hypothetical protein